MILFYKTQRAKQVNQVLYLGLFFFRICLSLLANVDSIDYSVLDTVIHNYLVNH